MQLSTNWETLRRRISSSSLSASIFRKLEQIVGEPRETPRVLEDNLEEADTILRIVDGAGEKRFRKT